MDGSTRLHTDNTGVRERTPRRQEPKATTAGPLPAIAAELLYLQRTVGNSAVNALLRGHIAPRWEDDRALGHGRDESTARPGAAEGPETPIQRVTYAVPPTEEHAASVYSAAPPLQQNTPASPGAGAAPQAPAAVPRTLEGILQADRASWRASGYIVPIRTVMLTDRRGWALETFDAVLGFLEEARVKTIGVAVIDLRQVLDAVRRERNARAPAQDALPASQEARKPDAPALSPEAEAQQARKEAGATLIGNAVSMLEALVGQAGAGIATLAGSAHIVAAAGVTAPLIAQLQTAQALLEQGLRMMSRIEHGVPPGANLRVDEHGAHDTEGAWADVRRALAQAARLLQATGGQTAVAAALLPQAQVMLLQAVTQARIVMTMERVEAATQAATPPAPQKWLRSSPRGAAGGSITIGSHRQPLTPPQGQTPPAAAPLDVSVNVPPVAAPLDVSVSVPPAAAPTNAPPIAAPLSASADDLRAVPQGVAALGGAAPQVGPAFTVPNAAGPLLSAAGAASGRRPAAAGVPAGNGYTLSPFQVQALAGAGLENVPVLGDGTCLWHALVATGAIPDVRTARNAVADMVEEDQEQMANIQAFVTNATSAEIVRQIRQSGQFNSETGDLIPILITIKYGFRLRIFEPDTTLELADMGGAWHSVIHFTSPGMHYHAARPQAGV